MDRLKLLTQNWAMSLSNSEVQRIVDEVAIRFGQPGLVSAHRPQNRDALLVVQLIGSPSYEFSMNTDASADEVRKKAEDVLSRS